jgi:hypothetical protein
VQVVLGIGVEVMPTMMGRPPERAFLIRRSANKTHYKLESSTALVSAVGKEPVKASRNRKHANDVKRQAGNHSHHAHAGPKHQQAGHMHEKELSTDRTIQFFAAERLLSIT